ncbi:hypothetical protein EJB05_28383, partial [Eragrostis curvula]
THISCTALLHSQQLSKARPYNTRAYLIFLPMLLLHSFFLFLVLSLLTHGEELELQSVLCKGWASRSSRRISSSPFFSSQLASMNRLVRLPSHRCVELDGSAANLLLHTTHRHSKSGRAVFYSQRRVQRERRRRFGLGARADAVASRDDSGSRLLSTRGVFCK